jgi:hypothetical protein
LVQESRLTFEDGQIARFGNKGIVLGLPAVDYKLSSAWEKARVIEKGPSGELVAMDSLEQGRKIAREIELRYENFPSKNELAQFEIATIYSPRNPIHWNQLVAASYGEPIPIPFKSPYQPETPIHYREIPLLV